jgi:ferric-dicitrate binding protein FerR (iron transport regulator)
MSEDRLNQALEAMRNESVPEADLAATQAKVWEKLRAATAAPVAGLCREFREELRPYRDGKLADGRRLLLEDHLGRCPECRRLYAELKGERKVVEMPVVRAAARPRWQAWAIAASVALVALFAGRDRIDDAMAPSGARAHVESVTGELHLMPEGLLKIGANLGEGQTVRTSPGTRAVLRLADGSAVEMNERTELYVHAAWSGQTIQLQRGDVIVQAAKQRRGHLRVRTRDSEASVKGTVFAVSAGMAGSVVTVLEGAVQVKQTGSDRLVKPGEQAASTAAVASLTTKDAVAWSANAEQYIELINEIAKIEKKLAAMPGQALRTQARLLPYLPEGVVIYGAAPNLNNTLQLAVSLAEERARENESFRQWWDAPSGKVMREMLTRTQTVLPMLGDEIAFALAKGPDGNRHIPLVFAEYASGRQAELKAALGQLLTDAAYTVTDRLMLITDTPEHLAWATASLGRGANSVFATDIAQRYQRGAGWLIGLDVANMPHQPEPQASALLGATRLKSVFFEQRTAQGAEENEATLAFDGARSGMAAWLATSGSTGAAEYISSEAIFAMAGTTKEPRQVFDEIVSMMSKGQPGFADALRKFETEAGVNVANDIAASLGTDFAVAVETAALPLPGSLAAIEVYKPATLDATVRQLVEAFNNKLTAEHQGMKLTLAQQTIDGRVWTSLTTATSPVTVYWTYDRGYLIMSNERGVATRAIQNRDGGFALVSSTTFRQQLPTGSSLHPSGFLWFNLKGALQGLLSQSTNPLLRKISEDRDPILIVVNGETERIRAASRTRLTSLVLDGMLAGSMMGASSTPNATMRKHGASN